jgi:serine/threonine-protein kinase HipA
MMVISKCPGTLKEGYTTYSAAALRHVFKGKKVSHILPYIISEAKKEQRKLFTDNRVGISISGVQEKVSLRLEKNILRLAATGGEYILKPIPTDLDNLDAVPANEHITMQLATQVYKLDVAKNAIIFFGDGEPAYITKRFDVMPDGRRCLKEDFASVLQKTSETGNKNFKYESSYALMAEAIDQFLPAPMIAKEKLFQLAVFNYLFSNGDAHLKNFSVIDYNQDGVYQLAPAYDLLCTRLHINDSDFALEDRLHEDDYKHPSYSHYGYHAYDDFYDFGIMIGLRPNRVESFMHNFLGKKEQVETLVKQSFLNESMQVLYLQYYNDKLQRFKQSLSGKLQ